MIQRRLLFLRKYSLLFKQFVAYVKGDGGVVESVDYLYSKFTQAPNASILQIPTSYKTSVLYNQEPFNPSEDFDVIRNSTVPRFNQDGNWEEVPVNTPCIDYSTGEPLLLTQPQSTDLIEYSEDFSNGWWAKSSSTVSFDSVTNPKGELGAYRLIPDNGIGGNRSLTKAFTSLTELHTLSVYAKYGGYRYFYLRIRNAPSAIAVFDFETETINIEGVTISAKFTKIKDGWFRIEATFDPSLQDIVGQLNISFSMSDLPNTASFDGDGSRFTYIWGAQFEQQSFATSYIETNGSVATRLGDVIRNAGSTNTINSEEGVLYFEGAALTNVDGDLQKAVSLSDDTADNRLFIKYDDTSNKVEFIYRKDGINLAIVTLFDIQVLEVNSFTLAWDNQKIYTYVNGVFQEEKSISDTYSANTLNELSFDNGNNGLPLFGKTKQLRVYKSIAQAQIDLPYIIL